MSPGMIIFDLDFTLWDCGGTWCDCLTPPFSGRAGKVRDANSRHVALYDDVSEILDFCDQKSVPMALASRTEQPVWAKQLLELLEIVDRFQWAEIYPSSKLRHFAALNAASGVEFESMLFFDDEARNIREVGSLGVTCVDVPNGLDWQLFSQGLGRFQGV